MESELVYGTGDEAHRVIQFGAHRRSRLPDSASCIVSRSGGRYEILAGALILAISTHRARVSSDTKGAL